jgi:hypothetical protein
VSSWYEPAAAARAREGMVASVVGGGTGRPAEEHPTNTFNDGNEYSVWCCRCTTSESPNADWLHPPPPPLELEWSDDQDSRRRTRRPLGSR